MINCTRLNFAFARNYFLDEGDDKATQNQRVFLLNFMFILPSLERICNSYRMNWIKFALFELIVTTHMHINCHRLDFVCFIFFFLSWLINHNYYCIRLWLYFRSVTIGRPIVLLFFYSICPQFVFNRLMTLSTGTLAFHFLFLVWSYFEVYYLFQFTMPVWPTFYRSPEENYLKNINVMKKILVSFPEFYSISLW